MDDIVLLFALTASACGAVFKAVYQHVNDLKQEVKQHERRLRELEMEFKQDPFSEKLKNDEYYLE